MSDVRDLRDYLSDMREMMVNLQQFTDGMTFDEFRADTKTIFAVIRAFEVLGEAAKHIPDSYREQYPDVPWRTIAAFRDKLIHEYFAINLDIVWNTIQTDIPQLLALLTPVVRECLV
ncbi:MAG TPA: DUF86 domain-containing protein, partial [Geobacteraceae bacterium]|nr:DUF86 domain-containing protein [Geobacteraceae bacterium]